MTSGNTPHTYVADPGNPTDEEIAAAIERGLADGSLIDAGEWMAVHAEELGRDVDTAPHMMVTWANAITTGQYVHECFPSRGEALDAAADGRRLWNNTRVDVCWHEAHDQIEARREMRRLNGDHRHIWGIPCKPCDAISAHRDKSAAEVEAARDAAGDHALPAVTS